MAQLDTWSDAAAYHQYVGRWSRLVGSSFLDWLAIPQGGRWLDVGCGAGNLISLVLEQAEPQAVKAVDKSPEYLAYARERIDDERASFSVADAANLDNEHDESYDAVISGLVINFVPEPERAVREMARVVRPGGLVAAYVWDYAGKMQMMRYFWDAVVEINAGADDLDESSRFQICNPDRLRDLWESTGFRNVSTRPIDVPTNFTNFDDYWSPFLGGQGPAPGYVASLDDKDRTVLRDLLYERLPVNDDGSISLIARAWAVKGMR